MAWPAARERGASAAVENVGFCHPVIIVDREPAANRAEQAIAFGSGR